MCCFFYALPVSLWEAVIVVLLTLERLSTRNIALGVIAAGQLRISPHLCLVICVRANTMNPKPAASFEMGKATCLHFAEGLVAMNSMTFWLT